MECHEVDYSIIGDDMQTVEIKLDPGEIIVAEAGAMNYMDDAIRFEAKMGDGTDPSEGFVTKLLGAGKRMLTGGSMLLTHFSNGGDTRHAVAFAAPYPGKIIPLNMAEYGGEIFCQKDAFLCAAYGTRIGIAFTRRLGTGFFGGEGFILQRLTGNGLAFLHAGGTVVEKHLKGQTLKIDTGCIAAFTTGLDYSIERAGNLKSMFSGGEGLFLATLSGTGTVFLQTLPFSRLADRIIQNTPARGGSRKGEGSVLGSLGDFFNGDNR